MQFIRLNTFPIFNHLIHRFKQGRIADVGNDGIPLNPWKVGEENNTANCGNLNVNIGAEPLHHFFIDVLFTSQYELEGVIGSNHLKHLIEGHIITEALIVLLRFHKLE